MLRLVKKLSEPFGCKWAEIIQDGRYYLSGRGSKLWGERRRKVTQIHPHRWDPSNQHNFVIELLTVWTIYTRPEATHDQCQIGKQASDHKNRWGKWTISTDMSHAQFQEDHNIVSSRGTTTPLPFRLLLVGRISWQAFRTHILTFCRTLAF